MRRIVAFMLVAASALIAGGLAPSDNALAHEQRAVGNYSFVVGFLNEPAIAQEPNGLFFEVKLFANGVPAEGDEAAEAAGQPVEGLEQTLKAEVIVGGDAKKMDLSLEPAFGQPGSYEGHFIPTLAADYTFHIVGKVQDRDVDETFSSGPETFDSVDSRDDLEFPDKLPTTSQLQSEINNSSSGGSDDTARILGILGIIAGVIGVAAGGVALASRRA